MDIRDNNIGSHGILHLPAIPTIGCINHLNLNFNNLLSEEDTIHVYTVPFDTFAEQLKYNVSLRTLELQGCGLNSQSAKSLAEALSINKHLETLNICDNALGDEGIQLLAHALRINQALKELFLASCGMKDVGFNYVAKSLQHNNV